MASASNCKLGPATTLTINSVTYYVKGSVACGIEGDVAFGTVDQYPVPFAAKYGTMQPYLKATLAEVVDTLLAIAWDVTAVTGNIADITPTDKDPSSTTASAAFPNGTFAISEAIACDFGEISAGDGDNVTIDVTYKGIDSNMTGGTGTWANA